MKKKAGKSRTSKSLKSLPAKALKAKDARNVKGGFEASEHGATSKSDGPKETITFTYGSLGVQYGSQKPG